MENVQGLFIAVALLIALYLMGRYFHWQNPLKTVAYWTRKVPDDYKCDSCGATGCKLWQQYQTFSPKLLCCNCAGKDQGKDVSSIDKNGRRPSEHGRTDQIGWYVPAVPDEEGVGYWGYTSVPDSGVRWWRKLPTKP